jgi:hypothetical protein
VRILHVEPGGDSGPLERWLATARASNADRLRRGFVDAGLDDVRVMSGPLDDVPFGARLRALIRDGIDPAAGLIVMGSGAIPLATRTDLREFARAGASGDRRALVNNQYSADVIAVGRGDVFERLPDLPGDNAVPRWLDEVAGVPVADLRRRTHLAMDLDSPLDVLLVGRGRRSTTGRLRTASAELPEDVNVDAVRSRLRALAEIAADRRAELLVAGRTSAATLRWLERSTACRIRALVEERGLRAAALAARAINAGDAGTPRPRIERSPRSVLGLVLDDRGPDALGSVVAELADGALIDSRVLLAHRLGADEHGWPGAEDRFASDLLLPERVQDPWLRALTTSARDAAIPIVLGGHSLVGPGVRFALPAPR